MTTGRLVAIAKCTSVLLFYGRMSDLRRLFKPPHKEAYFILLARGCHLAKRIALQANNASYCGV